MECNLQLQLTECQKNPSLLWDHSYMWKKGLSSVPKNLTNLWDHVKKLGMHPKIKKNFTNLRHQAQEAWNVKKWTNLWDHVPNQAFTFMNVCLFVYGKGAINLVFVFWSGNPKQGERDNGPKVTDFSEFRKYNGEGEKVPTDGHFFSGLALSSSFFPLKNAWDLTTQEEEKLEK
jgi:hypothetical protein